MVVFGAPTEMIEHEARAISTALAIVNRLAELRETAGQQQGFYHVKIGIHVGDLILTSIGNEKRSDYIAVGESANLAVRIQEQAKSLTKSGILVSKDIQLAVAKAQPGFALRPAGTIEIKGQSTPIEVYEVETSPSVR